MIAAEPLREKYRVQRAMAEEAGHDMGKLNALIEQVAAAAAQEHSLTFRYADIEGRCFASPGRQAATAEAVQQVAEETPEYRSEAHEPQQHPGQLEPC
jgi:hypothetical protein